MSKAKYTPRNRWPSATSYPPNHHHFESNIMKLFLDIETVPSQAPGARDLVRATLKPPGTLKKPESIAAWWQTEADTAADDAWRRQSFDALAGEIISIAVADDGDRRWVRCRAQGESEAALLAEFFEVVDTWTREDAAQVPHGNAGAWPMDDHFLIGHSTQFDVGFLWRRARVLAVPVPGWLPPPMARPSAYGDTMTLWAGFGGRVSLDNLCRALNVPTSKGDLDGSQVFDAWLAGEYERIATYNMKDVMATAQVWDRLNGGGV